jgi:alcohol dehydrogenase
MQALVYNGPGYKRLEGRAKPATQGPGDAVGKITRTTICGTDLQIIMVDLDDNRLAVAKRFDATDTVNSQAGDTTAKVMALTGGRGVDTAIEAAGIPATFTLCEDLVAAGGTIANVGAHGSKVDLHLARLWSHNVTITTRLVDTVPNPMLPDAVQAKRIDAAKPITQRFRLAEVLKACDTFAKAAKTQALKVITEA